MGCNRIRGGRVTKSPVVSFVAEVRPIASLTRVLSPW